jgi:hypothetical protein
MKKLLVLFLALSSQYVLADTLAGGIPKSPYAIEILNYDSPDEVLKNKKLEFGIRLSSLEMSQISNFINHKLVPVNEILNPFLEWELDVEVLFTHVKTGKTSTIDAFYFRDYVRDTTINDWTDKPTDFPFRVRFAPTETGDWTYQLRVKLRGKEVGGFWVRPFRVIESGAPGFASVHPNKRNLTVDGKIIFPVGQNLLSPVSGVDNYGVKPNETNKAARPDDWLNYHKDVEMFHQQGGDFIRFVQTAWSSLIEFEEKGNYYNRLHYAWEQDQLLDYCEANGMRMNFNFMFQEPIMNYGQYDSALWDFGHYYRKDDGTYGYYENDPYRAYCYNDSGREEPHNMFLDEDDLRYHEQRMRYYISRYGYSTSIMVFELLSEPFHLDQYYPKESVEMKNNEQGKIVRDALLNYNRRMSVYIKDSLEHRSHLIGVHAFDNTIHWQDEEAKKIIDESCKLPSIDVVGFSTYKNEPSRLIITKQERGTNVEEYENSYYRKITDFWSLYEKPVMHFEQGSTGDGITNPNASSNFTPHQIDVRTVGFTGCAGLFVWEGFLPGPDFVLEDVWKGTAIASDWMNSDSVQQVLNNSGGNWSQGRQAEKHDRSVSGKTKETEYYISEDQEHAVGFVLNRTANSYTMAKTPELQAKMSKPQDSYLAPVTINWNDGGKQLYASSLQKKTVYKITWYDAYTQSVISEKTAKTTRKGEFKLEFPSLTVESNELYRPVVWYTLSLIE